MDVAWGDAKLLRAEPLTERLPGQLYAAVSSISAHLGEGYSRSSGKDRARIFEFALSSVRESISWYQAGRPVLGEITTTRLNALEELRRLLLAIIPANAQREPAPNAETDHRLCPCGSLSLFRPRLQLVRN